MLILLLMILLKLVLGFVCCSVLGIFYVDNHAVANGVCTHSRLTVCNPMDCSPPGSLSLGFSRQEYWSGCHFLLQGIFLTQGSNPRLWHWQTDSLPLSEWALVKWLTGTDEVVDQALNDQQSRK